jgi:hypothetical protein
MDNLIKDYYKFSRFVGFLRKNHSVVVCKEITSDLYGEPIGYINDFIGTEGREDLFILLSDAYKNFIDKENATQEHPIIKK